MLKFHPAAHNMKDKSNGPTQAATSSPIASKNGTVMNPAFQDTDGLTNPQGGPTDTYGSYHTLANENYPTRSVSTVSPVSRGDYAVGRVNPGFFNDNGDTGVHVYPERRDGRSSNNNTGPITRPGGKMSSHKNYSPTEDRELPGCYTPVNSHRKLLRGEILYVNAKDHGRSNGRCCCGCGWRRLLCALLIAAILVVAIVIGSLSATGVIFNAPPNGTPPGSPTVAIQSANLANVQAATGAGRAGGVDIEVHEVDASLAETSPSRLRPGVGDISREPKSDETLDEWRRQHAAVGAGTATATTRPVSKMPTTTRASAAIDSVTLLNDGVPEAVEGELRLMNMDFQPALADRSSWIFQYTSNDLAVYLNDIFMKAVNAANYNATRVVSFRPGSVIVKYQALWNQASDKWDLVVSDIINRHLDANNNFIGNYLVDRSRIVAKSIFYTCRVKNGGCSHLCEFDLLEMRQYCLCPDTSNYHLVNSTTCVPSVAPTDADSPPQQQLTASITAASPPTSTTAATTTTWTLPAVTEAPTTTPTTTKSTTTVPTTILTTPERFILVSEETTASSSTTTEMVTTMTSTVVTTPGVVLGVAPTNVTVMVATALPWEAGLLATENPLNSGLNTATDADMTFVGRPENVPIGDPTTTLSPTIVHTDIATTETIAHGQVAVAPPKNDALTVGNSSSTSLVAVVLPSVFDIPPPVTAAAVVTTTTPTNPTVVTTSFPVPAMTDAVIVPFFEATHPAEHQETTAISEVDVSHVNDTFIGHVPIAFASGHGVSHVGTATTDDDQHEPLDEDFSSTTPVALNNPIEALSTVATVHSPSDPEPVVHAVPLAGPGASVADAPPACHNSPSTATALRHTDVSRERNRLCGGWSLRAGTGPLQRRVGVQ